jgi:hypothetical protein
MGFAPDVVGAPAYFYDASVWWVVLPVLAVLVCVVCAHSAFVHLAHPHRLGVQRIFVRMILMAPLFCFSALYKYYFPLAGPWLEIPEAIAEGYTVVAFFHLIVLYCGGMDKVRPCEAEKHTLETRKV